jgi:DNA-binding IclR family transcriptional regulator
MAAKAALYLAMGERGMTNVQLARKLGCDEKEVRRMLNPRHPTKLPRIKDALDDRLPQVKTRKIGLPDATAVRLKVEQNQLVARTEEFFLGVRCLEGL